ncbi:MAG: hypothetical protein OEU32_00285 [Acidimicrobiia bacterium]|nr:hypothetical protein [Acidimicrobiia bacterium]
MADNGFVWGDREAMLRDHAATTALFTTLVDVRFRLLTFIPTVTAIAVGIVSGDGSAGLETNQWLLVGTIGFVASLAVVVYEVRNSQIHDRAVHRVKHLERLLGFRPSYAGLPPRGMFGERGTGGALFGVLFVKHDRALALIYGVVLAAWTWVLLSGAEAARDWRVIDGAGATWVKIVVPVGVAVVIAHEISRLGGTGREPGLVYTLGDAAETTAPPSSGEQRGRSMFVDLFDLHGQIKERRPSPTLFDLTIRKTSREERLVDLALAAGVIRAVQIRWFWLWAGRDDRRDSRARRLKVESKSKIDWVEAIRGGVVGADEVFRAGRGDPTDGDEPAREELCRRYGDHAPWATPAEISLRRGLLEAAAEKDREEAAGRSSSPNG